MPNKSETPANVEDVGQPKREASLAALNGYAALPPGMDRDECIRTLYKLRELALLAEITPPVWAQIPKLDGLLAWVEEHGFPAPHTDELSERRAKDYEKQK